MIGNSEKYIDVMNVTDKVQVLRHPMLANGSREFAAYEVAPLPAQVWYANIMKPWLFRTVHPRAVIALAIVEQLTAPETAPAQDTEPSMDWKMAEIRGRADELGISIPVGTTKKDALDLVTGAGGNNE